MEILLLLVFFVICIFGLIVYIFGPAVALLVFLIGCFYLIIKSN